MKARLGRCQSCWKRRSVVTSVAASALTFVNLVEMEEWGILPLFFEGGKKWRFAGLAAATSFFLSCGMRIMWLSLPRTQPHRALPRLRRRVPPPRALRDARPPPQSGSAARGPSAPRTEARRPPASRSPDGAGTGLSPSPPRRGSLHSPSHPPSPHPLPLRPAARPRGAGEGSPWGSAALRPAAGFGCRRWRPGCYGEVRLLQRGCFSSTMVAMGPCQLKGTEWMNKEKKVERIFN